ncbi:MAG: hypothetical protein QOK43_2918 [Acidimicrobiaceae bacterium]|nr:hypothetical protein [Acidimicrobiaceae bacterium]
MTRLYLSPPDVGPDERELLLDAFDSNWIAPLGPHVDAFEAEFATAVGMDHAVALSSGTAALHLALLLAGVGPGDEVVVPTLTFVATANAVRYVGATPVLVDSEWASWNLDPGLVAETLDARRAGAGAGAGAGTRPRPKAVISVDLYGQCADYSPLRAACEGDGDGVVLIEDAAEALGATYMDRPAGSLGDMGVFSFNGNKIATTSGGGMLVTNDGDAAAQARSLSTQARRPVLHYEHDEVGFNYRLSNLLAAVGRGQLRNLSAKVDRRRRTAEMYQKLLADTAGITFMPEASFGRATRWLTVALIDPEQFGPGRTRDDVIAALEAEDIEARPAWMPMHRQPVYADAPVVGGTVADAIFEQGVCLPSGSAMTDADVERVAAVVQRVAGR